MAELKVLLEQDDKARETCIPSIDVFKEIMVELIKNREICIETLRKEKANSSRNRQVIFN